ncbi:UDP-2,3-diacylglucosamine diphosphatase [Candidatus Venteria ishoeyi]|uniref:UDP-2,3-diacylglucosamine diphosphatase n=1 Tax=Candidatus Venteria ishoeyi TaxID=1899563 RepID=UPI0025A4D219|nr:UDP-2,3-diacylglucosamine diphosphatase [Candidatus Venteria ishoeyi]MDM8547323.1 UDP-2,3-diacylglucosamine diphosphatase [Candidatus Venteria ishoeyi]
MSKTTLFISDLHLDASRPEIIQLFLQLLNCEAKQAEALYILGDLFEFWIGDDEDHEAVQVIKAALKALTQSGVPVFLMHGNRDFLLGEGFCQATGCTLLDEGCVIDLYGTPTVLMHGDSLCTDDVPYQQLRQQLRNPLWQQQVLAKSREERRALALQMRSQSGEANTQKSTDIMDVNADAVKQLFLQHQQQGVKCLIHGHTHRPATHDLVIDGLIMQRIVLGDWYQQGSILFCQPEACQLQAYHPA